MKKHFKDFYGCTATIEVGSDGRAKLEVRTARGALVTRGEYKREDLARRAMGRVSDGWRKQ